MKWAEFIMLCYELKKYSNIDLLIVFSGYSLGNFTKVQFISLMETFEKNTLVY